VHAAITAAAAFLVAVLWFDLMFDVQVWPHRGDDLVPVAVTDSIAAYYRRVTTDASPMGTLISVVMAALVALLVWQAARGGTAAWVSIVSLMATVTAVGLALTRVVPNAQRLGARRDPHEMQSALARGIFRDHLVFLGLMVTVLVLQLVAG
jgi:hypothetical protein